MLRPGLQLLRPPKKDARDGPGIVAGFVAYNSDAFREDYDIEPWQVLLTPLQSGRHCEMCVPLPKTEHAEPSWILEKKSA